MGIKDFSLWLLLACLWSSSFLAVGIGVETLTPLHLVAGRMILGALVLCLGGYMLGLSLRMGPRAWGAAFLIGLTGNALPFWLIGFAGQTVDSGTAALIMGIAPIVTLCVAPLVHEEERLSSNKALGGALGFLGVLTLVGPSAMRGLGEDVVAQTALVLAACCYAGTALLSRYFAHPNPAQMSAASVLAGALAVAALATTASGAQTLSWPSNRSVWALVYLGLGPTALAALIYFYLIPRIGAGRLQQVNYLVPILGMGLGMVFLGERLGWNAALAVVLILGAVFFVTRKEARGLA